MLFSQVDPEKFINTKKGLPPNGRGAWTSEGIGFDYRLSRAPSGQSAIGTLAEKSLAHYAVALGSWSTQKRLVQLKYMDQIDASERGIWGPKSDAALREFQAANVDPDGGAQLPVDGKLGRAEARSLWTPLIDRQEQLYAIPNRLLRGEVAHESALDVCAVGYYIFYGDQLDYRGVDRGLCQINSKANYQVTWEQAFDPSFAIEWSAKRMRDYFERFRANYPKQPVAVAWDAAVMAHNNPSWATTWAKTGTPPNEQAAAYVSSVKNARYGK